MLCTFTLNDTPYVANLEKPLDISIPLRQGNQNVNCFYAPLVEFFPVRSGGFVGSTQEGGLLNFKNIRLNPHGNGTHTECVGHISKEVYTLNQCLKQFFFPAQLVSIYPQRLDNGDRVITKPQVEAVWQDHQTPALVIRTLPNDHWKQQTNYSGANPPYLHHEAISWLVGQGVEHLLIDLPSVDREEDGGRLLGHKAFWKYPTNPRTIATISELIYVNNEIKDGLYLLNLQITSLELDASPSKPVLFSLNRQNLEDI